MTDTDTPTWRNAHASAETAAREWARDEYGGDDDAIHDAATEYADGSADVIYTYRARAIWMDSSEVQDWESEADGMLGTEPETSIDDRIRVTVYLALRNAFAEAALEAIAETEAVES